MKNIFEEAVDDTRLPLQLWLARHGSNDTDNSIGQTLNAEGVAEIERMAAFLRARPVHYPMFIATANVLRNIQTAKIIAECLADRGQVVIRYSPKLVEDMDEAILEVLALMGLLDTYACGLTTPPGSMMVIGNKRNQLVEMIGLAIDPVSHIGDLCDEPSMLHGMSADAVQLMLENDEFEKFFVADRNLETYCKAQLTGFELQAKCWEDSVGAYKGRRFINETFTLNPQKAFIVDMLKR